SQRVRLHHFDWDNPDAPPLVLVHGGRDHARSWDWVVARLHDRRHIIAPDLRGRSRALRGRSRAHALSGQPGRTDVGPGWLQLGACNARSSLGVPNGFTVAASTFV